MKLMTKIIIENKKILTNKNKALKSKKKIKK